MSWAMITMLGLGDARLVEMARLGDLAAFDVLVERFQRGVYAVAFAMLSDREMALDVLQESFVAAYSQLGRLASPAKFGSWVCGIARNQAKQARRDRWRLCLHETPLPETDLRAELIQSDDVTMRIREALSVLTELERDVVTLFYMEGYSIKECAYLLEVPQGTIKRRLHDARQRLKKEMTDMVKQHIREFALPDDYRVAVDRPSRTWSTAPSLAWFEGRWVLVWQDGEVWENPIDHTEGNGPFWFLISESADGREWAQPRRLSIEPQWQHLPKLCVVGNELVMHTHHHHYGLRIHRSKDLEHWLECPMIHAFDVGRSDVFGIGSELYVTYPIWRPHEIGDAVELIRSSDGGRSWSWANQPYPSRRNGITDSAGAAIDGRIVVAWRGHDYPSGAGNPNNVYICRSDDGGQNWSDPVPVEPLSTEQGSFSLQILRAPDGALMVAQDVCADHTAGTGEIWVAVSRDQGRTWEDKAVYSAGLIRNPAIAFAPDGSLMLAGSSREGSEAKAWVVHSRVEDR